MVDILSEFYKDASGLENLSSFHGEQMESPSPEMDGIAVAAEPDVFEQQEPRVEESVNVTEEPLKTLDIRKQEEEVQEVLQKDAPECATSSSVRDFLQRVVPDAADDVFRVFEKEGLLDWKLIQALSIQDMRSLGLSMGSALKVLLAVQGWLLTIEL
jgi:hypothetical protein